MNSISVIIPVFNEAEIILPFLEVLQSRLSKNYAIEIILVDGGSADETRLKIKNKPDIQIVFSEKGRAKQMNYGAKQAKYSILYFLHCDSVPPKNFDGAIIDYVNNRKFAGCFKMKFDYNHWLLKIMAWFTRFNHISCRGGDQSLFITKDLFLKIDGFDETYTIYEDNEICKRLYEINHFSVIQEDIVTSARKFRKNGVFQLYYHFFVIHLKRKLGHSVESLEQYYKHKIM
jgi:rSAM/selenodomain-associated transferase 2